MGNVKWNSSFLNDIVHTIWNITSHVINAVNVNSDYNSHIWDICNDLISVKFGLSID